MNHYPHNLLNRSAEYQGNVLSPSSPDSSNSPRDHLDDALPSALMPTHAPLSQPEIYHAEDSSDHLNTPPLTNPPSPNPATEGGTGALERITPSVRPASPGPQPARWHPSNDVNKLLLKERPGARMVITSDMELNSVLMPNDTKYPSAEVLVARLKHMYDICLSSSGVIHLELRELPESDVLVGGRYRRQA